MSEPSDDPGLAAAVAERALARTARGAALGGCALGLLALAFLFIADGTLDARSIPQLLLLGLGQLVGLGAAGLAVLAIRHCRVGHDAILQTRQAASRLFRAIQVLTIGSAGIAVGCLAVLRPFTITALSVVLSLAIVAQLALVLVALRGRLRRAADRD